MEKTNNIKWLTLDWIKSLPHYRKFETSDTYSVLRNLYPDVARDRADFEKDCRFGIDEASKLRFIMQIKHGVWERVPTVSEETITF